MTTFQVVISALITGMLNVLSGWLQRIKGDSFEQEDRPHDAAAVQIGINDHLNIALDIVVIGADDNDEWRRTFISVEQAIFVRDEMSRVIVSMPLRLLDKAEQFRLAKSSKCLKTADLRQCQNVTFVSRGPVLSDNRKGMIVSYEKIVMGQEKAVKEQQEKSC